MAARDDYPELAHLVQTVTRRRPEVRPLRWANQAELALDEIDNLRAIIVHMNELIDEDKLANDGR
jgi:hypothetical protein